jgi:hypothetical protein
MNKNYSLANSQTSTRQSRKDLFAWNPNCRNTRRRLMKGTVARGFHGLTLHGTQISRLNGFRHFVWYSQSCSNFQGFPVVGQIQESSCSLQWRLWILAAAYRLFWSANRTLLSANRTHETHGSRGHSQLQNAQSPSAECGPTMHTAIVAMLWNGEASVGTGGGKICPKKFLDILKSQSPAKIVTIRELPCYMMLVSFVSCINLDIWTVTLIPAVLHSRINSCQSRIYVMCSSLQFIFT